MSILPIDNSLQDTLNLLAMSSRKLTSRKISHSSNKKQDILLSVLRILLAMVFLFSGFVKGIDPLGSTYKFDDYFMAFGGFFQNLSILSFPAAIFLSTVELVLGLNLLLKVKIKWTLIAALLFMLVMTVLTLYIAIYNPVSDCGCFGDALVLSNWATFSKNIVITALLVYLLVFVRRIHSFLVPKVEWVALSVFALCGIALSVYCYRNLPLVDFLPYKVGVHIPQAMELPEGATADEYETTFIYAKDGIEKEFTLENYPKGDSSWVFVDQKSVLVKEGTKAPIHDFVIVNEQYEDITEDLLTDKGQSYLLVVYDLEKVSENAAAEAELAFQKAIAKGAKFYAITASPSEIVQRFIQLNAVSFPFYSADPIMLKTVIRANPGLVLIENGTVKGKWNWRDFDTISF